ncbi:hypothetical protein TWF481_010822 [Arthrobotrys musiformis]|uniref:Uncharacterized protein n=1 Tax=Arthrobotrys musiformis TaxID=47236 RepID=A0AAV9W362_9PEZI
MRKSRSTFRYFNVETYKLNLAPTAPGGVRYAILDVSLSANDQVIEYYWAGDHIANISLALKMKLWPQILVGLALFCLQVLLVSVNTWVV